MGGEVSNKFSRGERVKWTYTHHLNSVRTTQITKVGEYLREVKPTRKNRTQPLAYVKFDENRSVSRVPIDELRDSE